MNPIHPGSPHRRTRPVSPGRARRPGPRADALHLAIDPDADLRPDLPRRAGAEAVNNNCLACHSAGMVLTQPKLTKAQWTETVNKMVHVYKAPVDQADVQTIVDYLTALKPTP